MKSDSFWRALQIDEGQNYVKNSGRFLIKKRTYPEPEDVQTVVQ